MSEEEKPENLNAETPPKDASKDVYDSSKIQKEIGWQPDETFKTGIRKTIEWYLINKSWIEGVKIMKSSEKSVGGKSQ